MGGVDADAAREPRLSSPRLLSHAGNVGGEEVDAVAVEVDAGAVIRGRVVVVGGTRVGAAGEDLCVAKGGHRHRVRS